jgi:alcohol dehydrogenase (cytochrome c)
MLIFRNLCFCLLLSVGLLAAQGLDPAKLLQPPTDTWPTYNGDYSGRRYSTLSQINAANVHDLTLAWVFNANSRALKSTPLEVNGILYFTVPNNVWAVDARTGRQIWKYTYEDKQGGDLIGNRGLGMYHNWLYFETPDAHLISLEAKDGTVRWNKQLGDPQLGYFATMAPLIVGEHVLVSVSGDVTDIPGYLESVDPETGDMQWRWNTEPSPGEPGSESWPRNSDAITHGGGMPWMTGTYDPELHLVYWGIGNPNPVMAGDVRQGDNLYTCSIVALNLDTGKLQWYFQPSPHDVHDWDAVQTPVLFDGTFDGKPRRLLAQGSRNGYFFVLDRATGEHLLTAPLISTNWASGIDQRGRPIAKLTKFPTPNGSLVSPGSDGATNWMAPSFDPQTNLFYVNARRMFSEFYLTEAGKAEGWAGRDRNLWSTSSIQALDYRDGKVRWSHSLGDGESVAGILTTAGGVLFTGDNSGNLLALNPETGNVLWHVNAGGNMVSSPSTFQLDGRQYLLTLVQGLMYAWVLPDSQ